MNPEETKSDNTNPARDGNDEIVADDVMAVDGEPKSKRPEEGGGSSKEKIVIFVSDEKATKFLAHFTKNKPLEASVVPLWATEEFMRQNAVHNSLTVIFWQSVTSENNLSHLENYLEICKKFGHEKVIVVVIDLEDTKAAREVENEWSMWKYACYQLLTLTRAELDEMTSPQRERVTVKMETLWQILLNAKDISQEMADSKLQIGIFSRSDKEDYSWLTSLLRSGRFRDLVEDIRPCYICNNGFQQFMDDIHQCTFAILYHTMTRGILNVTDAEGSLYDRELEYLHKRLGRNNVIVVIDDLSDSSDEMKAQILWDQPSIRRLGRDLFLFSKEEKASKYVRFLPSFQKKKRKLCAMIKKEKLEVNEDKKEKEEDMGANSYHTLQNQSRHGNSGPKPAGKVHSKPEANEDKKEKEEDMGANSYHTLQNQSEDGNSGPKPAGKVHSKPDDETLAQTSLRTNVEKRVQTIQPRSEATHTSEAATADQYRSTALYYAQGPVPNLLSQINKKHVVGFFSSSSQEDFRWLAVLTHRHVKHVFSCYIGNSGFHHFMDDVRRCTFAILYHTMTRGRINITDVTDAIYDRHLGYMSSQLGKDNVMVVVDDVVNSSDEEKARILKNQPSIRKLARSLILISKQEKMDKLTYRDTVDPKSCKLY
ncbi:uncharacterized protein ACMZJ9_010460 isoform 1-T2 [Mantella aurantiaca]